MSTDAIKRKLDAITDWEDRARQAHYCVRALAALCGVAACDLEQYFRETRRVCPRCWLQALRMRDAQRLLLQGRPPKKVAIELGYKHYPSFSRAFKKAVGCFPLAFLREARYGGPFPASGTAISQNAMRFLQNAMRSGSTAGDTPQIVYVNRKRVVYENACFSCNSCQSCPGLCLESARIGFDPRAGRATSSRPRPAA